MGVLALLQFTLLSFSGTRLGWAEVAVMAVLAGGVAVGAALPVRIGHAKEVTPLATASAVALSLTSALPDHSIEYPACAAVLATIAGYLAGAFLRRFTHQLTPPAAAGSLPILSAAAIGVLYRSVPLWGGQTLLHMYAVWNGQLWRAFCAMVLIAAIPLIVQMLAVGYLVTPTTSLAAFVGETFRGLGSIYATALSTGVAMAIGIEFLSLWAVPLIVLPLVLARTSLRRAYAVRRDRRQTIAALSTMTDVAGFTRPGHAARVAALARTVGERLRMPEDELVELEDAALLHDIGQVTLSRPIPDGATVEAAPADQESIAQEGAAIVRRTGVLDSVADIVAAQATSYRRVREFDESVPRASRIIKVCNAFDDLTAGRDDLREAAFERLSLGLGYEYDPAIVSALYRIERVAAPIGYTVP